MVIDLEDRFFSIEIRFRFSIFTAKSEICISKFKSKFTNRKHPEPWNALLTSKEEEARKGALQIVRLITPLPAYRDWRKSPTAVNSSKLGSPCSWPSHLAQCSIIWCSFSRKKAIEEFKNKRAIRKVRAASAASAVPAFPCPTCGRLFKSRAGLSRHLPTHRPWRFCCNIRSLMVIVEYDRRTTTFHKN